MRAIGITGAEGFLGWHLRSFLHGKKNIQVIVADRYTFSSEERLKVFVAASDVIVHLAGMNRGDDQQVYSINVRLTNDIINACEHANRKPHIIFSSSIHIYRGTVYGDSKKASSDLFQRWSKRTGGMFTNFILPNVFGEGGMPFYNSVVSTFCYQIAEGQYPTMINNTETEQIHAQQVAEKIWEIIQSQKTGDMRPIGRLIKVNELLLKIKDFSVLYDKHIIPDLRDDFDLRLFNTYRAYLFPMRYPVSLTLHEDNRGALFEAVKTFNGGQTFVSTTKPEINRGNHYHTKKMERFLVIEGDAEIRLRRLFSDEVITFKVNGKYPQYVDIPTLYTHNITNTGRGELVTLFWSNEIFDPEHSDTFAETV